MTGSSAPNGWTPLASSSGGDNGIKVSGISPYWGGYTTPARVSPDGGGGLLVTWAAGKNIRDRTSSYTQRISADGDLLWGEDGVRLNQ